MMLDPSEVDLEKTPAPPSGVRPPRSPVPWLIGGAAVLAVGMVVWFFVSGRQAEEPATEPPPSTSAAAPPTAAPFTLCGETDAVALPSLDDSDALVGTLVEALSTHPRVTAWLATDGLIRNFTVVVENIANGASPAVHLRTLRPTGAFRVADTGEGLFVDPRSYERYTPFAAAVDSVDAQAVARLCATLRPRLEEAYDALGRGGSFDGVLERAIVAMLETPVLGENVRLVPRGGAQYAFRDAALENLTPAQGHLARMGVRNARVIQDKLRQIALAIGIPRERLPQ